jgi:hypothetical protein
VQHFKKLCDIAHFMRLTIDESKIPEEDRNSTVVLLLEIVHQQGELIQQLKDEIARL